MSRILVVDEDRFLLGNLRQMLAREGMLADVVSNGQEAIATMANARADLVLVAESARAICPILKKRFKARIVFLADRAGDNSPTDVDAVERKPLDPKRLLASIHKELDAGSADRPDHCEPIKVGDLVIDPARRDVLIDGCPLELTKREFELVAYLAKHLNKPIPRDQLFETIWGYDPAFNTNSLDVYIYRIRRRIERNPARPKYLQTMRGLGYKLVNPESLAS